jgi:hypothetical protein
MRNRMLMGALGLVAFSAVAWPADIWNTKPVREWTREETQQFLLDSPWTHRVFVGGSLLDTSAPGDTAGESAGWGESSAAAGRVDDRSTVDVPLSGHTGAPYLIEWRSAKIFRRAGAHLTALQSQTKEVDAEPVPLALYVLSLEGPNLKVFDGVAEAELKASAYLRPKHAKTKIEPTEVRVQKAQDGRVIAVHFAFPRQMDGQPVVSDQEKSVEFSCKAKELVLKTSFNLAKMTTAQGRDL